MGRTLEQHAVMAQQQQQQQQQLTLDGLVAALAREAPGLRPLDEPPPPRPAAAVARLLLTSDWVDATPAELDAVLRHWREACVRDGAAAVPVTRKLVEGLPDLVEHDDANASAVRELAVWLALSWLPSALRSSELAPWASWTPVFASAPAVAVDDIVAAANAVETVSLGAPEEVVEVDSDEAYEPLEVPAGTPGPWAALFGGAGSANDADAPVPVRAAEFVAELSAAVDRMGHHDAASGSIARWMLAPGAAELPDLLRCVASLPPPASQGLHRLLLAWLRQDIGSTTVILPNVLQSVAASPPSDTADTQAWSLVAAVFATAANAGPVAAPLLRQVLQSESLMGMALSAFKAGFGRAVRQTADAGLVPALLTLGQAADQYFQLLGRAHPPLAAAAAARWHEGGLAVPLVQLAGRHADAVDTLALSLAVWAAPTWVPYWARVPNWMTSRVPNTANGAVAWRPVLWALLGAAHAAPPPALNAAKANAALAALLARVHDALRRGGAEAAELTAADQAIVADVTFHLLPRLAAWRAATSSTLPWTSEIAAFQAKVKELAALQKPADVKQPTASETVPDDAPEPHPRRSSAAVVSDRCQAVLAALRPTLADAKSA